MAVGSRGWYWVIIFAIIWEMYNWSVDEKEFKRKNPKEYKLWRLTQLINYGLDGEKLDKKEVKKAWPEIKERLDPYAKRLIEYLI